MRTSLISEICFVSPEMLNYQSLISSIYVLCHYIILMKRLFCESHASSCPSEMTL